MGLEARGKRLWKGDERRRTKDERRNEIAGNDEFQAMDSGMRRTKLAG